MARKALVLLSSHDWPGNVRELINVLEYAFVLCSGDEIKPYHLPATITRGPKYPSGRRMNVRMRSSSDEKTRLLEPLKRAGGNKSEAVRILGISRVTLWKRLKAHDITMDRRIQG